MVSWHSLGGVNWLQMTINALVLSVFIQRHTVENKKNIRENAIQLTVEEVGFWDRARVPTKNKQRMQGCIPSFYERAPHLSEELVALGFFDSSLPFAVLWTFYCNKFPLQFHTC